MIDTDRLQLCVDGLEISLAERDRLGLAVKVCGARGDSAKLIQTAGIQRLSPSGLRRQGSELTTKQSVAARAIFGERLKPAKV